MIGVQGGDLVVEWSGPPQAILIAPQAILLDDFFRNKCCCGCCCLKGWAQSWWPTCLCFCNPVLKPFQKGSFITTAVVYLLQVPLFFEPELDPGRCLEFEPDRVSTLAD